jgi:hypothetical protein
MNRNVTQEYKRIKPAINTKSIGFYLHTSLPIIFTCLAILFTNPATASESQPGEELSKNLPAKTDTSDNTDDEKKDASENNLTGADAFHDSMSRSLNATANWVDSFFGKPRATIEGESNSLRLKLSVFKETSQGLDFESDVKLRLVLPNLEDKLHLIISSNLLDDQKNLNEFEPGDIRDINERDLYLSLRYFIKAAERRNLSLRAGLKLHSLTPIVFAGPRYSFIKKWDSWDFRFIEDLTYFSDDGWESMTTVDFEKSIYEALFYRLSLRGWWQDIRNGYVYWTYTDLFQTVNEDKMFDYRLGVSFDTYPRNQMTQVLSEVRYRQRFWKKWLFFEIAPQIIFRREEDYDPSPGITLSLEMFFGKDFYGSVATPF